MKQIFDNTKIKASIRQKLAFHNFDRETIEEVMVVIDKRYPDKGQIEYIEVKQDLRC